ncbi:hypothetical protein HMPREF1872_00294 [Amygdalobacter nucleatus]|uniref:Uncharacterized protein n=1 Tax=Amygdalobacter nucleatus TaxID=3029274 RepID=A0A133YHE7_9FIRM|nr:hypothetical protein HMPREF1872_00294 [Amygdalobacter nucleatus]
MVLCTICFAFASQQYIAGKKLTRMNPENHAKYPLKCLKQLKLVVNF